MIICLYTHTYTDSSVDGIMLYLSTNVLWSYITYRVCLVSKITDNAQTTLEETHADAKQLEEDAREEYGIEPAACELLMKVMVEGKLYLNPKLTISEVANAIGTNRTYLSNYFNNTLQTTFYDFINNFRIENASKQLLESTQPLHSIEEVAEQSGFNSVSTFRRAFVKNTGMSPLKFRKSMSNQTVFKA